MIALALIVTLVIICIFVFLLPSKEYFTVPPLSMQLLEDRAKGVAGLIHPSDWETCGKIDVIKLITNNDPLPIYEKYKELLRDLQRHLDQMPDMNYSIELWRIPPDTVLDKLRLPETDTMLVLPIDVPSTNISKCKIWVSGAIKKMSMPWCFCPKNEFGLVNNKLDPAVILVATLATAA